MVLVSPPETMTAQDLASVREAISQLQQERDQFDSFLSESLDEIERMWFDLTNCEQELVQRGQQLTENEHRFDEMVAEVQQQQTLREAAECKLVETQQQLDQLASKLQMLRDHREAQSQVRDESRQPRDDESDPPPPPPDGDPSPTAGKAEPAEGNAQDPVINSILAKFAEVEQLPTDTA